MVLLYRLDDPDVRVWYAAARRQPGGDAASWRAASKAGCTPASEPRRRTFPTASRRADSDLVPLRGRQVDGERASLVRA